MINVPGGTLIQADGLGFYNKNDPATTATDLDNTLGV